LESDQREYFVPCPHCGEYQVLELGDGLRVGWPGQKDIPKPLSIAANIVSR